MEYGDHTVPRLRELLKEWGVRGYSRKRKAELIAILRATEPQPPPPTRPRTYEPARPQHPRPSHPMRPPPLPSQSVRFRPDRPRQPELLRQLEEKYPLSI